MDRIQEVPKLTDVLDRVMELLRGGWCQGGMARTYAGQWRHYADPDADRFCLAGAVLRAAQEACGGINATAESMRLIVLEALVRQIERRGMCRPGTYCTWGNDVIIWNDAAGRTQAEVLALVQAARDEAATEAARNTRTLEGRR